MSDQPQPHEQNAASLRGLETKPTGGVVRTSLVSVVTPAQSNQDGFLTRILTQLGALSSASAVLALVGKIFGASDFQTSLLGTSCLAIIYIVIYSRKVDGLIPASWIFIGAILVATVAGWNKDQISRQWMGQSGFAKTTGIVEYVPHANDWLLNAGKYMEAARQEIWLTGVSFYVTLPMFGEELLKKLGDGVNVRFLVYNPLSANLKDVAAVFGQTPEQLASETKVTIENLRVIETKWRRPTSDAKFEVRLFSDVPRQRIYIFDRRSVDGYTFFIPHVDNQNTPNLPGFLARNITTGVASAYFVGVESVWKSAQPFDEFLKSYDSELPATHSPDKRSD